MKDSEISPGQADGLRVDASAPSSGWQPIETAPRGGEEILAYSEHGCTGTMLVRFIAPCDFITDAEADVWIREGCSVEDLETEDWFASDFLTGARLSPDCYPTHWMPLPTPPSQDDGDRRGLNSDNYGVTERVLAEIMEEDDRAERVGSETDDDKSRAEP